MNDTVILVTPNMAKEWLEHNTSNRPIKMKTVESFMRDMKAGNWLVTHQGIAFDEAGELIDGQHRLTAVALSGVPCKMRVFTDVPRECMIAVDVGVSRTPTDVFKASDIYVDGKSDFHTASCMSIINTIVEVGYGRIKLTNAERMKLIDKFGDEAIAVWRVNTKGTVLSAPIRAAALAAILNGEPVEDVQKFLRVFASMDTSECFGLNIPAALNFSHYVLKSKANKMRIEKARLYMLSQNAIYQFIRGDKKNVAKGSGNLSTLRYPVYDIIKNVLES